MRTVKYQAWTDEGMINVARITFAGEVVYVVSDNDEHDGYEFQISPDKLRCFTGLKDKNGVDIYEGDIVKCHIFVQELGENYGVTEGEREFVGEVKLGVTGFNVEANGFSDNPVFYESFHEESLEVIGNIYEHPELLKESINA